MTQRKPPKLPDDMHLFQEVVVYGKKLPDTPKPTKSKPEANPIVPPRPIKAVVEKNARDLTSGGGVDASTLSRLRKGLMPIDDTIDLHGHTLDESYRSLTRFLERALAADKRCLLIITGKGSKRNYESSRAEQEGGTLRREVPP